jgi:hypothetical protein
MSLIGNLFGNSPHETALAALDRDMMLRNMHPGAIMTASTSTLGQIKKEMMHGLFPDSVGQTIFDGRLVVTKVLNGYVVQYMHNPNQKPDVYVESDLDGVNARIKALMTTFRLEKP